ICPDASVRGFSIFNGDGTAGTIRRAADALQPGDIMLIELHRPGPRATGAGQFGFIAIEWWPDDYAALRYATNKGIIVVEAAGNGSQNLDDPIYDERPAGFPATWSNPFNPANPSSMTVVAGAGAPPPGTHGRDHGPDRSRLGFSNYGARVDAQGWGREVTTAGYGDLQGGSDEDLWYTDRFSGTSSASPIVVGALACVQGVLRAQGGNLMTPADAIQALRATGSPQQDAPGRPLTQRIGNRPDLRQLIPQVAKLWHYNQTISSTYVLHSTQAAWAHIDGLGWRRIKPGAPDGVSNMLNTCCAALGNNRKVHVFVDNTFLYRMYLV
ncbi:MAG: S8 family serine peptidase, partial [Planctomycetales bacterium]|nr:S8 family serine peptidase [Planctomycetales bacterium]NIM07809.1 S8 family serine peptidase [Planctomycetales bacterium]NIN07301.1 S8 family serine peptidase [Planctomycetales bacterium]NIP03479.1 S8 family serine peptidase [Planctomycetales bacterium]